MDRPDDAAGLTAPVASTLELLSRSRCNRCSKALEGLIVRELRAGGVTSLTVFKPVERRLLLTASDIFQFLAEINEDFYYPPGWDGEKRDPIESVSRGLFG